MDHVVINKISRLVQYRSISTLTSLNASKNFTTIQNLAMAGAGDSDTLNEEFSASDGDWISVWYQNIISYLPDINFTYWLGWLLTPIALAFLLPIALLILIYISSFIVFA